MAIQYISERRVDELGYAVGFHAKTAPGQHSLNINQIILFHNATQNSGDGFHPTTGIFHCPKSGLYFFSVTIMTFPGHFFDAELVLNGQGLMSSFSGKADYVTGTNTVVQTVNKGDELWVRVKQNTGANHDEIGVYGGGHSTFTGFLIQEN